MQESNLKKDNKISLSPLLSRISPALKRKSLNSWLKPDSNDSCATTTLDSPNDCAAVSLNSSTSHEDFNIADPFKPSLNRSNETSANLSAIDHSSILTGANGSRQACDQCRQNEASVQVAKDEKVQVEKQLGKAREEIDRMSELIKDMEHKWTEVAKDYEKQVIPQQASLIQLVWSFQFDISR